VSSPLTPPAAVARRGRGGGGGGGGGSPPPPLAPLNGSGRRAGAAGGSESGSCDWASSDESVGEGGAAPSGSPSMASSDVPAVFRAEAASRYALFPIRHQALWDMYKKHQVRQRGGLGEGVCVVRCPGPLVWAAAVSAQGWRARVLRYGLCEAHIRGPFF